MCESELGGWRPRCWRLRCPPLPSRRRRCRPIPSSALRAAITPAGRDAIDWTPPNDDVGWPVIAVVDTGMWAGFDDFAGYLDDQSADCVGRRTAHADHAIRRDVNDADGHGTQVATVAAAPANGKGSVGVSPDSHADRRARDDGWHDVQRRLRVRLPRRRSRASSCWSSTSRSRSTEDAPQAEAALQRLIRAGALVVAATGNFTKPPAGPRTPSTCSPSAAARRALARVGPRSTSSRRARGIRLPELDGSWRTGQEQGTSYASPIVAGVAARVWGAYGDVDRPAGDRVPAARGRPSTRAPRSTAGAGSGPSTCAPPRPCRRRRLPVIAGVGAERHARRPRQRRPACTARMHAHAASSRRPTMTLDYWRLKPRHAARAARCASRPAGGSWPRTASAGRVAAVARFVKVSFPRSVARRAPSSCTWSASRAAEPSARAGIVARARPAVAQHAVPAAAVPPVDLGAEQQDVAPSGRTRPAAPRCRRAPSARRPCRSRRGRAAGRGTRPAA